MKGPYVILRPHAHCGHTKRNKFYRALLTDLPAGHKLRPGVRVALHRLPEVMDHLMLRMRSKHHA